MYVSLIMCIYMKHHVKTIHDIKCIMDQIVYRIHYILCHMFYESNILYITYIIITCWWWLPPTRCNKKNAPFFQWGHVNFVGHNLEILPNHHGTLATQYCCVCSLLFFFQGKKLTAILTSLFRGLCKRCISPTKIHCASIAPHHLLQSPIPPWLTALTGSPAWLGLKSNDFHIRIRIR